MADAKFSFIFDIVPSFEAGTEWPMKSSAMMVIREINVYDAAPIRGRIENGISEGAIFTWNADGTCNNGDVAFHLKTPEERDAQNQPKKPEPKLESNYY